MTENLPEWVDRMAELIDLPVPPEYRDGVIANFERICQAATVLTEFPLPDDIEVAPVFEP